MSRSKAGIWVALVWGTVFCALAVAGGLGTGYIADLGYFGGGGLSPVELSHKYSFIGPLKQDDLKLSRSEIIALNNSAWRARDMLTRMDIQVGCDIWDGEMSPDDVLRYTFEFGTSEGGVVKTWPHETPRGSFVKELGTLMDTAVDECRRCRDKNVSFKALYI